MRVEITMEKTQRINKVFEVTKDQFEELKIGINPFEEEMEKEIESGDCGYDYVVNDEDGNTIIDWI